MFWMLAETPKHKAVFFAILRKCKPLKVQKFRSKMQYLHLFMVFIALTSGFRSDSTAAKDLPATTSHGVEISESDSLRAVMLIPYLCGEKYGFADHDGNLKIGCQFDEVGLFDTTGLAPVRKGDAWAVIDQMGRFVVGFEFGEKPYIACIFYAPNAESNRFLEKNKLSHLVIVMERNLMKWAIYNRNDGYCSGLKYGFSGEMSHADLSLSGFILSEPLHRFVNRYFQTFGERNQVICLNMEGREVLKDKYRSLIALSERYFLAVDWSGKNYLTDTADNSLALPDHMALHRLNDSLFIIAIRKSGDYDRKYFEGRKHGLLNWRGQLVIDTMYEALLPVNESFLSAKLNDRWGALDSKGKTAVPFVYDLVGEEAALGHFIVECNGLQGIVDTFGNFLLPLDSVSLDWISDYRYYSAYKGRKEICYDANLKRLTRAELIEHIERHLAKTLPAQVEQEPAPVQYVPPAPIYAKKKNNGKYVLTDADKKPILPKTFDLADQTNVRGIAYACDSIGTEIKDVGCPPIKKKVAIYRCGLVNTKGQFVVPMEYESAYAWNRRFWVAGKRNSDGKHVEYVFDNKGNLRFQKTCRDIYPLNELYLKVKEGDKCYLVDSIGTPLFEKRYDDISHIGTSLFHFFQAWEGGNRILLNLKGQELASYPDWVEYDSPVDFSLNADRVMFNFGEERFIVDRDGNIVCRNDFNFWRYGERGDLLTYGNLLWASKNGKAFYIDVVSGRVFKD